MVHGVKGVSVLMWIDIKAEDFEKDNGGEFADRQILAELVHYHPTQ